MEKKFIEHTGIHCKETYPITKNNEGAPIIDFDNRKQTIYNSDFQLSRSGNITTVIEHVEGDAGEIMTDYPIYKKDYLNGIVFSPTLEVDIEIKRGNTAAFEKHFKLSECNTLEDLENYGNNIFNL